MRALALALLAAAARADKPPSEAPDPESGGTGSGINRGPPKAQLRANFEAVPFAGTTKNGVPTGKNRDDDLLDSYYGDKTLEVLLDAQELAAAGPGTWYFGVAADSSGVGSLSFRVSAELAAELACPVARGSGKVCDGAGQCRKHLGRCDCDAGAARDDCSADGVFALDGAATATPAVPPDDWVYYRVIVGCDDRMLDVQFSFTAAGSGAKPRVYLRKGRLPLMLPETYDYVDLYTESGGWQQRIVASACGDSEFGCTAGETVKGNGCCVKQLYPGTAYANGAPEPGVYYVGIYNDASATQSLSGYSLSATVSSASSPRAARWATRGASKRPCPTRCPRSRCGRSATRASRRCTTATTPRRASEKACSRSRPERSPTTASVVSASELCPAPPNV